MIASNSQIATMRTSSLGVDSSISYCVPVFVLRYAMFSRGELTSLVPVAGLNIEVIEVSGENGGDWLVVRRLHLEVIDCGQGVRLP